MTTLSMLTSHALRGFALLGLGFGLLSPAGAQLQQITSLTGLGLTSESRSGASSALSADGNAAIVGAPLFNSSDGGAWTYTRSGNAWNVNGSQLTAGTGATGAGQQGYAVAVSGDGQTALVGAPFDNSNAGAFWFYLSGSQQGSIHTGAAAGNQLGASVALSGDGNTALIGAPGANSVAVWVRSGSFWSLQTTLTAGGSSGFGTAVSLASDGNTALIGAPATSSNAGGAWAFSRSGATWGAGTQLPLGIPAIPSGRQGMSVSLSGNGARALVGGYNAALAGATWVYRFSGGTWLQEAKLAGSPSDATAAEGGAVALSADGNTALVGAYNYNSGAGIYWAFGRSVNPSTQAVTWSGTSSTAGAVSGWQCGASVAVNSTGDTALVGCPGFSSALGFVAALGVSDLTIAKTHNGTFTRGAAGSYKIQVTNTGSASTTGIATVTDIMPSSLTYTGFSGSGWSCSSATVSGVTTVTCNNSTVVAVNASYADLTLNVTVSLGAPNAFGNTATVSGGGETNTSNNSSTDLVTIPPVPDLSVTKSHSANLYLGQTNVPYTIRVSNINANSTTTGLVTVTDTLPVGLSLVSMTGTGWACAGTTCTRSDALAGGSAYPPIIVTVNVSASAPATVINRATVSGGGEVNPANNVANDSGNVGAQGPDMTLSMSHSVPFKRNQSGTYWIIATNNGLVETHGTVTVTDTLPAGLTATSISGNGWKCTLGTLTCTRGDVLPPGLSYRYIAVTVNISGGAASSVTNTATVSGGGESAAGNSSASDVTAITN